MNILKIYYWVTLKKHPCYTLYLKSTLKYKYNKLKIRKRNVSIK